VSLDHAARLLGVSRRTIYNRIRDKRLQTIRTIGGSQRVLVDSIEEGWTDAVENPGGGAADGFFSRRGQLVDARG
jgi:excisionase family DNA binding protein